MRAVLLLCVAIICETFDPTPTVITPDDIEAFGFFFVLFLIIDVVELISKFKKK